MKKVYLIELNKGNNHKLIIPRNDYGDDICFRSKKTAEEYIMARQLYRDDSWQYCSPKAVPVNPKDNIAGEYMYIDRIHNGIDYNYETSEVYSVIEYSDCVYTSEGLLKCKSGLYEYVMNAMMEMDEATRAEYINEGNRIRKKNRSVSDLMSRDIDYRIYKLKIV